MKSLKDAMCPRGFAWRAQLRVWRNVVSPVTAFMQHGMQIVLKSGAWFLLGVVVPGMVYAAGNVHTSAGFETGKFQPASGQTDAFFVRTLPNPQIGNEIISTGSGGGGPTSNWDMKVVGSETVASQIVEPRKGNFFVRSMLFYDKDYTGLNGGLPKPRSSLNLTKDIHRFNFDEEGWLGVSIFIPRNFEDETTDIGNAGAISLIVANTDSSATFFVLQIFVPIGETKAHWVFQYGVNDQSVAEQDGNDLTAFAIPVEPDKGLWTDFVIRYRSNPFSVDTNPADLGIRNANDRLYLANKGIMQVWKAEGGIQANGDRRMVRKYSVENAPVGLVPGTTQGKSLIHHSLRVYKYSWQRRPTAVKGPVWIGFDEFRYGQVAKDGTAYSDVHPSGRPCTDRCPADDSPRPKAPRDLVVSP